MKSGQLQRGHLGLGCSEPEIEACSCGADDYCGAVEWDVICVMQIDPLGCGTCG